MRNENYYTPEEEAMAFKAKSEAVVSIAKTLRTPDWEQRRYEIAKDIFVHRMMLPQERRSLTEEGDAEIAVDLADALIYALKKGGEE